MPGSSTGIENAPAVLLTASNVLAVALFLTITVAPGTTPPAASTTTPASDEFALPWAIANVLDSTIERERATQAERSHDMLLHMTRNPRFCE